MSKAVKIEKSALIKTIQNAFTTSSERAFQDIVELTPELTGKAKKSWRIKSDIKENSMQTLIFSDVPYMPNLEYGSSQKAPHGMVRISINRVISNILSKINTKYK